QTCPNRYTITRTYQAMDSSGNTRACDQVITVNDTNAPTITAFPTNTTVLCASQVPAANDGAVSATGYCGGTVTITHDDAVVSTQTCANRYTITRTYHAIDSSGNTSTCNQTITVYDTTGPTITAFPTNTTVLCASQVPAANDSAVSATGSCGG